MVKYAFRFYLSLVFYNIYFFINWCALLCQVYARLSPQPVRAIPSTEAAKQRERERNKYEMVAFYVENSLASFFLLLPPPPLLLLLNHFGRRLLCSHQTLCVCLWVSIQSIQHKMNHFAWNIKIKFNNAFWKEKLLLVQFILFIFSLSASSSSSSRSTHVRIVAHYCDVIRRTEILFHQPNWDEDEFDVVRAENRKTNWVSVSREWRVRNFPKNGISTIRFNGHRLCPLISARICFSFSQTAFRFAPIRCEPNSLRNIQRPLLSLAQTQLFPGSASSRIDGEREENRVNWSA